MSTIIEGDERQYQASSPDELAIITFCKDIGLELFHRDQNVIKLLHTPSQIVWTFHVLHIFPFSSETKRMGIVVRAESDAAEPQKQNPIIFLSKGADAVMRLMVQTNDWYFFFNSKKREAFFNKRKKKGWMRRRRIWHEKGCGRL